MSSQFDAFLSHNSEDKEIVRRIAQALEGNGIKVWFDEWELRPGIPWIDSIDQAFKESLATVVFVGPHGLGKWEMPELRIALDRQVHNSHPVIPVLLPGITNDAKDKIPNFLRQNTWVDFSRGDNDDNAMDRLIWGITGKKPQRQQRPVQSPAPSTQAEQERIQEAVANLAQDLATGNVTFFLGWSGALDEASGIVRACDVARELMLELQLINPGDDHLLPPIDLAGLYYAIARNGERNLENKVADLLMDRATVIPETHKRLAALLQRLSNRPPRRLRRRVRQLIVTTNLDVLMERALLRAGLSFTRIVQHRSAQQITVNEYREVKLIDDNRSVQVTFDEITSQGSPSRKTETAGLDEIEKLDGLIASSTGKRVIGYKPVEAMSGANNPLSAISLENMAEPILYKFLGSQDAPDSCVISTSQYFEFAQRAIQRNCIPAEIAEIVSTNPGVFFGMGYLEPDFRLMCHLLLRKQLEVETNDAMRYALQSPPAPGDPKKPRRIESRLWNKLKDAVHKDLGITTLEERGENFLQMLIDQPQ